MYNSTNHIMYVNWACMMASKTTLTLMMTILLTLGALAGCADDDEDPLDDGTGTPDDQDGDDGMTDPDDEDPMGGDENETEEETFTPEYLNGTIAQGIADCSAPDPEIQAAIDMTAQESLPEGAGGRSYELTVTAEDPSEGAAPNPSASCISFDGTDFSTDSSGSVPDGATDVWIGVDTGFSVSYSLLIS